jgi:hypothetical protein
MDGERMSDTQFERIPGGGPSLVQSTKSDKPGMRGSDLSLEYRFKVNDLLR